MTTLIFGAGGHALEVLQIAVRAGVVSLDSRSTSFVVAEKGADRRSALPFPSLIEDELASLDPREPVTAIVAVGSSGVRARIVQKLDAAGLVVTYPSLIDPSAVVPTELRERAPAGLVVFPLAFVSERVVFGVHCHVNVASSISHEARLDDFVTVAPRTTVCGRAVIGAASFLGASSTIIDDVHVAAGTVIGAGAVVVRTIDEPGTYVGVPARRT